MKLRTLAAIMCAMIVGTVAPQVASGNHWWFAYPGTGNPTVVHLNKGHVPAISFYNRAGASWLPLEHARGEWSAHWAVDVYNVVSDSADVVAWDGNWCTPWSGYATGQNWDGYHAGQMTVQINTCSNSYAAGANYSGTKAVGCQEIGHAIGGQDHEGGSCMGLSYFNFDPNVAAARSPGQHDFDILSLLWNTYH